MDFTISEAQIDGNKARPVVDIRASREKDYITSRFAGGFAIYDHDVSGNSDYPDDPSLDATATNPDRSAGVRCWPFTAAMG